MEFERQRSMSVSGSSVSTSVSVNQVVGLSVRVSGLDMRIPCRIDKDLQMIAIAYHSQQSL